MYHQETNKPKAPYGSVALDEEFDRLWNEAYTDFDVSTDRDDDFDEESKEHTRK